MNKRVANTVNDVFVDFGFTSFELQVNALTKLG